MINYDQHRVLKNIRFFLQMDCFVMARNLKKGCALYIVQVYLTIIYVEIEIYQGNSTVATKNRNSSVAEE